MKSFQDECSELAPLETFDPAAFLGDATVPQELCDLILSLALIYNDCKNVIYSRLLLGESRPQHPVQKDRAWGAWGGIYFHSFRLLVGLLHELFDLIRNNQDVIRHPFLASVINQLPPPRRKAWNAVITVAFDATPKDSLGRSLLLIRHKVSAHYDPKAVFGGYKYHFVGAEKADDRAFISRGNNMQSTRFYFADAAATGWLRLAVGKNQLDDMEMTIVNLLRPINHALMGIVETFIQKRGYAYRAVADEKSVGEMGNNEIREQG
jgi:hypothetical protein